MMHRTKSALNRQLNKQFGAALLSAMLTVTLVATFAAAALWQQWRSVEVEIAERARVQVAWLLVGALDWSRLILRIDARAGTTDHLAEPWAVALQESRLSTFLAADKNNTGGQTAEEQVDAFLSGHIVDAQSKLNVFNLVEAGQVSEPDLTAFKKLFAHFNLPATELEGFVAHLKAALNADAKAPATTTLMPQRVRQLTWLGLQPQTLTKLTPYITLLFERTTVNINTAPAEVILASVPGIGLAEAKLTVFARESAHFTSLEDADKRVPALKLTGKDKQFSLATHFFEVTGRIRLEQTVVQEQSLVQRDVQNNVKTLWRERSVVASPEIITNASSASSKLSSNGF
jgi:general secretion pathway protein K